MPSTAMQDIQEMLRTHIAEILYCAPDEIEDDATFSDLGVDSILGAELTSAIKNDYAIQTDIEIIHQYPTIERLAAHLAANLE